MITGILCPSIFELRSLRSLTLPRDKAELFVSGMGKLRALHACHEFVQRHGKVKRIVVIGYAGSLSSSLKIGDLIEPDVLIEQDYDARPLEKFPNLIHLSSQQKLLRHSKRATMLTQDRFLKENPFRGTPLAKRHPALACDMESYAVAFFCRIKSIAFSSLKLISDEADSSADHDFLKACRQLAPRLRETVMEALSSSQG